MSFMKRVVTSVLLLVLVVSIAVALMPPRQVSAVIDCGPGGVWRQFGRCANEGYYTGADLPVSVNGNIVPGTGWIWPDGRRNNMVSANDMANAAEFIDIIERELLDAPSEGALLNGCGAPNSNILCEKMRGRLLGTAYIVNTMLGVDGTTSAFNGPYANNRQMNGVVYARENLETWKFRVNYYAARGWVDFDFWQSYSAGQERLDEVYYNYGTEIGSYVNRSVSPSIPFIRFYIHNANGSVAIEPRTGQPAVYSINKDCGNITGFAAPLIVDDSFAVTAGPTAELQDANGNKDPEAAARVVFSVTLGATNRPINNVSIERTYTIEPAGGGAPYAIPGSTTVTNVVNFPLSGVVPVLPNATQPYPLPPLQAGDRVCVTVRITPGSGRIDPNGNVITPPVTTTRQGCDVVENHPYVRAFGADMFAGTVGCSPDAGWPNTDATNDNGGIYGSGRDVGNGANGSANQLALLALGPILGFRSGALRTTAAPFTALNFANTATPNGRVGVNSHCPSNFFGERPAGLPTVPAAVDFNNNVWTSNTYTVNAPAGGYRLPVGLNFNKRIRIYVNGDLIINNPISFATGPWASTAQIPRLTIIVNGNIYIHNTVTRLDGVFIAQADSRPEIPNVYIPGTVYTCTKVDGTLFTQAELYGQCNHQLVINGALVANRVKFLRTFGSTRDSRGINERPTGNATCSNGGLAASASCAAEVINYTPEIYMAPPEPGSPGSGGGRYDYIVFPPPIF